jgi:ankyrin
MPSSKPAAFANSYPSFALPGWLGVILLFWMSTVPTHAFELDRDEWLQTPPPLYFERDARPRYQPLDFSRIGMSANEQLPVYAGPEQRALIEAAEKGNRTQLEILLKVGINPNAVTGPWDKSALIYAVGNGDVEMVRVLLDAGAYPNQKAGGYTPLGLAAKKGHARIAELLLRAGAYPDLKSNDGNTPLFLAARFDHADVIRVLLPFKPDFRIHNKGFIEPMEFNMFVLSERPYFAKIDLNVYDYNGITALGVAALENNVASLKLLLEGGAEVGYLDRGNLPAIFFAIFRTHRAATDLLLAHGADPGVLSTNY